LSTQFNYFNYFTEIEERFQKRRGSLLLLSTLDWALIEMWREAGIPLEAVLRGIDTAFDRYESRQKKSTMRRVNGLAWCAQAVLESAEELREAAIGTHPATEKADTGFERERVIEHLIVCANSLSASTIGAAQCAELASFLQQEIEKLNAPESTPDFEALERALVVLEGRLFATLESSASLDQLITIKDLAARELAPYKSRMKSEQLKQIEAQFLHKKLLELANLQRLSLFYIRND
jgi:hypothetical protein